MAIAITDKANYNDRNLKQTTFTFVVIINGSYSNYA